MRKRVFFPVTLLVAAFIMMAGMVIAPHAVTAQEMDASPTADMVGHPAHIHAGTCDTLGEVVFPLEDVAHMGEMTDSMEAGSMAGSTPSAETDMMADGTPSADMDMMADVVAQSTSTVDASLDDILAAEHAINVHESMENIQNYIACGDITGMAEEGMLEIQLDELNESGFEGMATLTDNGDGTTTVVVHLMMADVDADDMATPTS